MLRTFFRSAIAALALLITAASAGAQGWSVTAPIRQGIEAACKSHQHLAGVRQTYLVSYSTMQSKKKSAWLLSDLKENDAIQNSPNYLEGTFVTVAALGSKVLSATMTSGSVTGDGGVSIDYCYVDGTLVLVSAEVVDITDDMVWTFKRYYDHGKVIAEQTIPRDLRKNRRDATPAPPQSALAFVAYATPAKLPFYAAFTAARAGKLPKAK
jgi:hypothetical protein